MDEDKKEKIIQKVLKDNHIEEIDAYYDFDSKKCTLDGRFTIKELKLIIEMFGLILEAEKSET